MVSLSDDSNRGNFLEDHNEDDDFLTESTTLSLIASTEQKRRTINTTCVIIIEIFILVCTWTSAFILPQLCGRSQCTYSSTCMVLFIVATVWFLQLVIDRFYRNQHYRSRLCGYLNFYRQTRNIRRLPLLISSAALACLLITTQILLEECPSSDDKCGPMPKYGYIQIVISISSALQILLLIIYTIRTINFNKSGATPDVNQEEMVTSFLETNTVSSDIGFRDGSLMDQVLEKQADMIRYLKQHNEQLSKKMISLSEENDTLKQRFKDLNKFGPE